MKQTFNAVRLALANVRSRLFHTFLSILGIVIGVAALVGTLSLIDGMEKYANDQIAGTTSLQTLNLRPNAYKLENGIRFRKEDFPVLTFQQFTSLLDSLEGISNYMIRNSENAEIFFPSGSDTLKTVANLAGFAVKDPSVILAKSEMIGRLMTDEEVSNQSKVCVINSRLAKRLSAPEELSGLLGEKIITSMGPLEVVGIGIEPSENAPARLAYPFSLVSEKDLKKNVPSYSIELDHVAKVLPTKEKIGSILQTAFPQYPDGFAVNSSEMRVKQAEKGFLLFRVIMGMIVGLSVLVGGIGVMNVMLISVNERTTEIGICKAIGAKRKHIFTQFLSESITISGLGSFLGLVLGILATLIFVPVVSTLTGVPFQAEYTFNTLFVIGTVALLVGVVFGTYPALRASTLDPVEAMRRD